jgi:hypothetical protein
LFEQSGCESLDVEGIPTGKGKAMTAQTTTRSRKSRASRAADQAEAQPQPEAQADQDQGAQQPQTEPQPQPEPEPSQPTAQLSIGRYPYWLHRPRVTAPDGTVHTCQHRDGHVKIKDAMICARSLGREFGLTVPDPDPAWADGGPGEPVA